jgi:hypothetical protein
MTPLQQPGVHGSASLGLSLFVVYRLNSQYGSPIGGTHGEWWMGSGSGFDATAWSTNGQWLGSGNPTSTSIIAGWELAALVIDSLPSRGEFPHAASALYMSGALATNGFMDVPTTLQIGVPTAGYYFSVYIAEVLVFGRALFDAERQSVEGYLARKFALTLTAGHPLASFSPAPSQSASNSPSPTVSRAATYSTVASPSLWPAPGGANIGPPALAAFESACFTTPLITLASETGYVPLNSHGSTLAGYPIVVTMVSACDAVFYKYFDPVRPSFVGCHRATTVLVGV